MASWLRVAVGLQLVAEQAAKIGSAEASGAAQRAAQHGYDAAAAALASASASSVPSALASHPAAFAGREGPWTGSPSSYDGNTDARHSPFAAVQTENGVPTNQRHQQPTTAEPAATNSVPTPQGIDSRSLSSQDQATTHTADTTNRIRPSDAIEVKASFSLASQQPFTFTASPPKAVQTATQFPVPPLAPSPPSPAAKSWDSSFSASESATHHLKEGRPVPSTRIGRAAGFAQLGVGLAMGAAVEGVSRLLRQPQHGSTEGGGFSSSASSSSILVNEANSDRLAESLCRMRGAALKMGQMLSIQDETLMPPALQRALVRVRQGAEAMPRSQLERQMADQLGPDWRDKFATFDDLPFAAASIGQVHRAAIRRPGSSSSSGNELQHVVVKVQYPGVAKSIRSDLRNLSMLVTWTGMAPPGLFIDNVIRVGEQELTVECDYRRELSNQRRIRDLVEADPTLRENRFVVPDAVPELSTDQILTNEFRPGGTIDKVTNLSQDERNRIGRAIMYLTMKELFVWRFMQTDPNWGNFLYDMGTGTTSLIDFGATREYSKSFVDGYLRIVWASANRDEGALMKQSHRMNFLTGDENEQMLRAHKLSGYTVGEPFFTDEPFDFRGSNISTRMGEHTSVFLRHRLTPPPEEVYTLHRKLAGAYMLCIKLGAVVECRSLLQDIVQNHVFEDGLEPLIA